MIDPKYKDLWEEDYPKMLLFGLGFVGVKEIVGKQNNPIIMGWAATLKVKAIFTSEEVPWCGLFQAYLCHLAGYEYPETFYRALSWKGWGNEVQTPMLGDLLAFERPGGGHIAQYVGEDADAYHVLGGNQSNSVGFTRIEKSRLRYAGRAPWKIGQPPNIRRIHRAPSGPISADEK